MEAGQLGGQGQTIDNLHILSVNNDSDKCRRLSGGSDNVKCEVVDFVLNVIVTEAEYSEDLVAAVQEDTNKEEDENPASELVTRMADCEQKARLMPTLSIVHEEAGAGQQGRMLPTLFVIHGDAGVGQQTRLLPTLSDIHGEGGADQQARLMPTLSNIHGEGGADQQSRLMPTFSVIHEEGGAGQEYQVAAEFYRLWCDDTVTVKFLKVFDSFPFTTIVHTVN